MQRAIHKADKNISPRHLNGRSLEIPSYKVGLRGCRGVFEAE